jgi:hypothetical protein
MARIIEFKIATRNNAADTARGMPVILQIGERSIKFVLQRDDSGKASWLTHYASGYKFGSLNDAAVELMCVQSPYHRYTGRQLAEFLVDKMVAKLGADKVLASIDSVPVINN